MTQKTLGIILIVTAAATFFYVTLCIQREATMLFVNGTVYTLDANNSVGEALALQGDRILAVGSNDEMKKRFTSGSVIDLQGRTIMPGLIDGHGHVLGEGSKLTNLDVTSTTSAEQVCQMVAKRVSEVRPGQWISGRGWDQNDWQVEEFPTHELLDRVAPENPVYLTRVDGHAVWANARVMELAGITSATTDPEGGKIYRDSRGNPTGIFVDNAKDLIAKIIPELTDEEIEQRLKLALRECAKLGLTEVHDMGVDLQTLRQYKKIIDDNECPVRVYAAIGGTGETWNTYLKSGKEIGYGNGMLTVRTVKMYIDGALGSRGAALMEEYSDDHGNRGLTVTSETELETVCRQAIENGFQVCVHAIGDRGNDIVLNVYEKVLKSYPNDSPDARWRIEHAQVLTLADIPRFHQLHVIPSMQPTHATSDMYWAEGRLGPERIKVAYAWQSLLQTGVTIVGGSDFPVEGVNPLWGIYAAATRSDRAGYPQEGWYAQQKMTREQAVRAFSQWAAYGAFEENEKGTIEPGKLADLTILSKDIMKIPANEILTTDVEMTIVGGKIVYQKPSASNTQ